MQSQQQRQLEREAAVAPKLKPLDRPSPSEHKANLPPPLTTTNRGLEARFRAENIIGEGSDHDSDDSSDVRTSVSQDRCVSSDESEESDYSSDETSVDSDSELGGEDISHPVRVKQSLGAPTLIGKVGPSKAVSAPSGFTTTDAPVISQPSVNLLEYTTQLSESPCELLMYGIGVHARQQHQQAELTPESALGWRIKANYLRHIRSHRVAQGLEDEAINSGKGGSADRGGETKREFQEQEPAAPTPSRSQSSSDIYNGTSDELATERQGQPQLSPNRVHRSNSNQPLGFLTKFIGPLIPYGNWAGEAEETNLSSDDGDKDEEKDEMAILINPEVLNSYRLNNSLLLPIERRRRVSKAVFNTSRIDSHLWRLMVETTAPESWFGYLRDGWYNWQSLTGKAAVQDRFTMLSVFEGQPPPKSQLKLPAHQNGRLTPLGRRRAIRQEVYERVMAAATGAFQRLVIGHRAIPFVNYLSSFTFERLMDNGLTLDELFIEVPSNAITFNDFVILFELDTIEVSELAMQRLFETDEVDDRDGDTALTISTDIHLQALNVLKQIGYDPSLHFKHLERFPITCLLDSPWNITWHDVVRLGDVKRYSDVKHWQGFFGPHELHALGFKFKEEVYGLKGRAVWMAMSRKAFLFLCGKSRQGRRVDLAKSGSSSKPSETPPTTIINTAQIRKKESKHAVAESIQRYRYELSPNAWSYEDLWWWLDFNEEVISHLRLTQYDMRKTLGYNPEKGLKEAEPEPSTPLPKKSRPTSQPYYPATLYQLLENGDIDEMVRTNPNESKAKKERKDKKHSKGSKKKAKDKK